MFSPDCFVKAVMNTPTSLVCSSMCSPGWFSYCVKQRGTLHYFKFLDLPHFISLFPFCFPDKEERTDIRLGTSSLQRSTMFPALHASTLASPLVSPAWSSLAWADGGMGVCTRRGRCPQTSIIEAATNQVLLVASSVILSPNYWLWLKAGWRAYLWTSECASVYPPPNLFHSLHPFVLRPFSPPGTGQQCEDQHHWK